MVPFPTELSTVSISLLLHPDYTFYCAFQYVEVAGRYFGEITTLQLDDERVSTGKKGRVAHDTESSFSLPPCT